MRHPRAGGVRVTGRVAALLAAVLTLLVAGPAGPVGGPVGGPFGGLVGTAAAAPPSLPLTLTLGAVEPAAPQPGGTLTVTGTATNRATNLVDGVSVRLRLVSRPFGSRGEIARVAQDAAEPDAYTGRVLAGSQVDLGPLAPDASRAWSVTVPVDSLGLPARSFGVYQLAVEAVDADQDRVGVLRTFLPWYPPGNPFQPLRLAWLWPLVDVPRQDAQGVFTDDRLATELRPGGALDGLLGAGAQAARSGVALTWVVDPQLLATVAAMAQGYQVRAGTGTTPGSGQVDAARWLAAARAALGSEPVVALGYADPDAVALQRAGLERDLTLATTQGATTAASLLGRPVTGDVAWPAGGLVDPATLETLRAAGVRAAVVSEAQAPPPTGLTYTPTGRVTLPALGGSVAGLVPDAALSGLIATDLADPAVAGAAVQRFLAETALVTAERPGGATRTVLVAPPRRWRPPAEVAARLLAATKVPWVSSVGLDALRAEPPPTPTRPVLDYPAQARSGELAPAYLEGVAQLRAELRRLATVVVGPSATVAAYDGAILALESAAWRGDPGAGRALFATVRAGLDRQVAQVRLVATPNITLASQRGLIPVTVVNDLTEPVTVGVVLRPRNSARLVPTEPAPVTVAPRSSRQLDVPVAAVATGLVTVDVALRTPQGEPFGAPVAITVRATRIGPLGLAVTGGALVVLFALAGLRIARRVRRARTGQRAGQRAEQRAEQRAGQRAGR